MPAPRKFTHAALQKAALELVDQQGLGALTMRNLAVALGTGPMTIYNYVDGRDGLEALLVEAVLGDIDLGDVPTEDWRADLRAVSEANWMAIRAHPEVISLLLSRRSHDEASLRVGEAMLDALVRGGRSGFALLAAFRAVTAFVHGFAQAELNSPLSHSRGEDAATITERVQALPPDQFPHLISVARTATASAVQDEFHAGLDIVLRGL